MNENEDLEPNRKINESGMAHESEKPANIDADYNDQQTFENNGFDMSKCEQCGRSFFTSRIEKHMQYCARLNRPRQKNTLSLHKGTLKQVIDNNQVQQFDLIFQTLSKAQSRDYISTIGQPQIKLPLKQNLNDSNNLSQQYQTSCLSSSKTSKEIQLPKWKKDHLNFLNSIRSQKDSLPDQISVEYNDDYVQCPYCQRKFSYKVSDRHIEACRYIQHRPKPPPSLSISQSNYCLNSKIIGKEIEFKVHKKQLLQVSSEKADESALTVSSSIKERPKLKKKNFLSNNVSSRRDITQQNISYSSIYDQSMPSINTSLIDQSFKADLRASSIKPQIFAYKGDGKENNDHEGEDGKSSKNHKHIQSLVIRSHQYSQQVFCPNCKKFFSKKAGERHLPLCQQIINKPKVLVKNQRGARNQSYQNTHDQQLQNNSSVLQLNSHINESHLTKRLRIDSRNISDQQTNEGSLASIKTRKLNMLSQFRYTHNDDYMKARKLSQESIDISKNKYCTNCGSSYKHLDRYCGECGYPRKLLIAKKQKENSKDNQIMKANRYKQ